MLNLTAAAIGSQTKVGVSIAGVSLNIDAPPQIVDILRSTLYSVPPIGDASPALAVSARRAEDSWEVTGSSGTCKMLDAKSSGTQVAGALVSSAIAEAANARALRTVRATVVEINGSALAMVGSDWESTVTIATHLHTRGWRYLSGDHALYDPMANEILGFEKALYVTSSSIAHLPIAYRGAIEASPWCVTRHGLSFYAVDPKLVTTAAPWAPASQLRAVLLVDGRADDLSSIETIMPGDFSNHRFGRLAVNLEREHAAELTVGSYVETCDLIERWFSSLDA